jgi:hypothetical protein
VISDEDAGDVDHELEWKLRAIAIPVVFGLALVFHASETGHWLQRTFLTMIPHELGHAITAWWSGYAAIPSVWKTIMFDGRGVIVPLLVAALNVTLLWRGWQANRNVLLGFGVALGGLQLLLTTASESTAQAAFTFGGDAGAMVIGTLLVLAFFAPAGSQFRRGGLRWGLLVIGAATITDTFATWWAARSDRSAIPFGEIEGVGLSDASKLVDVHGWTTQELVERYVLVGSACVLVVAAAYAWGVYSARRSARS